MNHISKSFSGVKALDNVSISCKKGHVHAMVGENGAGKSTLIKILSGAQQPDKGNIYFKDKNYSSFSTREALNSGISVIYQELTLISEMTVVENIFLGREIRKIAGVIDSAKMEMEANRLLKQLGINI